MFIQKKRKLERQREKDILEEMQDRVVQDALDRTRKKKKPTDKKVEQEVEEAEEADNSEEEESRD